MNQLPAHIANRQRRNLVADAAAGINVGQGPHISIKDNRFTLVDGAGNERQLQTLYIDLCIIDVNRSVSKIFFDPRVPYTPGNEGQPPVCFSDNGVGASARASQPQSTSCGACQWNAWGSKHNAAGEQIKACSDVKKVAVVVPGETQVFMLRIPPASLKNFAAYSATLASHGVDLPDVLTRAGFASQGVLNFTPMGYIDEATAAMGDRAMEAQATVQMLGKNDQPWDGQQRQAPQLAPPPQQAAPALAPPTAQPAPMFQQAAPAPQFMPPPVQQPAQQFTPPPAAAQMPAPEPTTAPRQRKPRTPKPVEPAPSAPPFMAAPPSPASQTQAPVAAPSAPPAAPVQATPSGEMPGIPSFLQRGPAAPPAAAPQQGFGMQAAAAPDAGMQAALDAAFNLPIPGGKQ